MESPAVTDNGDETWTMLIPEIGAKNPAEKGFAPRQLLPDITEVGTVFIASNLGILRSVEFGAAKLHFD
jgi:hypothetical protein